MTRADPTGAPRPAVSVILCVRDGGDVIGRQLAALDQQLGAPPFEVVVVNNGSTDDTATVVANWSESQGHAAQSIKVVDASQKPGIPFARNRGIEAARGDILAFCDADDQVDSGWVRAFADGVPVGALAGGRVSATGADGRPRTTAFPDALIRHNYLPFAPGCNMAGRHDVIVAIGGFDESLPPYGYDDVEFSWRAQLSGYALVYVPDAVVHMQLSGRTSSVRKRFLLGKGRILMAHRFPEYDGRKYTLRVCTSDVLRSGANLAIGLVRPRAESRSRLANHFVSSVGRLWGFASYRLVGAIPAPLYIESGLTPSVEADPKN